MRRWLRVALATFAFVAAPASAQIVPTPGPLDLVALVLQECGPTGYRVGGGCMLDFRKYPKGVYKIQPTKLGTCDSTGTQRLGLTIIGRGTSLGATVPRFSTGGTVFEYAGPAGGTMLSICGSWNFLTDIVIEYKNAAIGVEWRANNAHAAISHFGGMQRFNIRGDGAGTGLRITGEDYNDQIDFLHFEDGTIMDTAVGYEQDSQQAVNVTLENVEITARKRGWVLKGGSALFLGGYIGQWPALDGTGYAKDFIGFHLTKSDLWDGRNFSRQMVVMRDWHAEIHDGLFLKDDSGSNYPVMLQATQFQHLPQSTAAAARLWSIYSDSPGNLILDGVSMTASTPTGVTATPRICRKQGPPADVRSLNRTPWMGALEWRCP